MTVVLGSALLFALVSCRPGDALPASVPRPPPASDARAHDPGVARPRCTLAAAPTIVGRRGALGSGLALARSDARNPRVSLAWSVPSTDTRCESPALAELDLDGALLRTVSREEPPGACDHSDVIEHLCVGYSREQPAVLLDREQQRAAVHTTQCGDTTLTYPRRSSTAPAGPEADPAPRELYSCRSLAGAPQRALGLRLAPDDATVLQLVALRNGAPTSRPVLGRIALEPTRGARLPDSRGELQLAYALDGFDSAPLRDQGFVYAFRLRGRIYVGAVDAALAPRGPLAVVPTLGTRPGKPRLAVATATPARADATVLLLFADAPGAPRDPGRYTLRASVFTPPAAPSTPVALETDETNTAHEFAPSAAALDDGSWLVTWTQGPLEVDRASPEVQRVRLRRYEASLQPAELPLFVNAIETGSDARIVSDGARFVLAGFAGRGMVRSVVAVAGRCAPPGP